MAQNVRREARGSPGGIPVRVGYERAHQAPHTGADGVLEWSHIHLLQLGEGGAHARQGRVGVLGGAPVTGIVFGAPQNAVLLDTADPHRRLLAHAHRSEEHTSELQSQSNLVCRLLLEKKKNTESSIHAAIPSSAPPFASTFSRRSRPHP